MRKMKRNRIHLLSLLLALAVCLSAVGCGADTDNEQATVWQNPYSDVSENHWSYGYIARLSQLGIFPDTQTLGPGELTQRGDLASYLYAMAKTLTEKTKGPEMDGTSPFTDVSVDDPNFEAILWAKENGIIYGVSDTKFEPQGSVTRQNVCVIFMRFVRYAGAELAQISEATQLRDSLDISAYARSSVTACQMAGIVSGYEDKTFRPTSEITREQCAVMLCGLLDGIKASAEKDAVLVSTEEGAYDGVYEGYADSYGTPVSESEAVDVSWFDDVAFIGDSVSVKLQYYAASTQALGDATFLCAGSLSASNALHTVTSESTHPTYQGKKMALEDSVALSGVDKVYIMLGMNNIAFGLENSTGDMVEMIDRILEKSPDVTIVIQSVTPMAKTSRTANQWLNNDSIAAYNQRMQEICHERGWYYLAVEEMFKDEDGYLIREYCSDPDEMGIHFSTQAAEIWVEYLKTHVPELLK